MNKEFHNNQQVYIFLDLDGVLVTTNQYYTNRKKWHPMYDCYRFDEKCVKVFNQILEEAMLSKKPIVVLSSDWGKKYSLEVMNRIFEWNNVKCTITDITPNLWGIEFMKVQELEACRASEIIKYVCDNNVQKFIVIDDYDLNPWFEANFIHIKRANEGIKQLGIKEKIIKFLKEHC